MNQLQRYYDIFGLKPGVTLLELKSAYRDLVRVWHPDRFGDDPRLQLKAQERLKEVNEAYLVLQKVLAESPAPPVRKPAAAPPSAAAQGKSAARPESATGTASPPSPDAAPVRAAHNRSIATFVSFWPNILLLILLVATFRLANLRHGLSLAALGYVLQMLVIPLLFAFVCNSSLGTRRTLWAAYLVMLALVSILLVLDGLSLKKELQEASPSRYPVGEELPFGSGGGLGGSRVLLPATEPWRPVERKPSDGPMAPLEPNAPVVPQPVAPAAPVVPSGR